MNLQADIQIDTEKVGYNGYGTKGKLGHKRPLLTKLLFIWSCCKLSVKLKECGIIQPQGCETGYIL